MNFIQVYGLFVFLMTAGIAEADPIRVVLDHSHEVNHHMIFRVFADLKQGGYTSINSLTTLDHSLVPGSRVRVRQKETNGRRPFVFIPAVPVDAVISIQTYPLTPPYTDNEIAAAKKFVEEGGGLILAVAELKNPADYRNWSAVRLAAAFGIELPDQTEKRVIKRDFGKGRVVVFKDYREFLWDEGIPESNPRSRPNRMKDIMSYVDYVSANRNVHPRENSFPDMMYPEKTLQVGALNVFYTENTDQEYIAGIEQRIPKMKALLESWLPDSKENATGMAIVLGAGPGGGGFAERYIPNAAISYNFKDSLHSTATISHEVTHTMFGPPNERGQIAAEWLDGNAGEAHAGWFQGKVDSFFRNRLNAPNRSANDFLAIDPTGKAQDLSKMGEMTRSYWGKIWWTWQKLDDRYGTTWYPRWRWVQSTRWANEPQRKLTFEETIEDMSIAVGEDLFPFYARLGTTLSKQRFPEAEFNGTLIQLPIASLDISLAGPVRLEPAGDYKKPIGIRE